MSSSIVALGNLGGGMIDCCKWLLLMQEVDENMACINVKKTAARVWKK